MFRRADLEKLKGGWVEVLRKEFAKPYFSQIESFLAAAKKCEKVVFPPETNFFAALQATPLESVKVVILGQDPYHGSGQAHGLSFSVPKGQAIPPSLRNIFKELSSDLGIDPPTHGDLTGWASQGVLLLNSVFSVEKENAGSHAKIGWEYLSDAIIKAIDRESPRVVFIFCGAYAQKKCQFIDREKHLVLASVHPSPLSASRGFFGSKPFSKANAWLKANGIKPVDWSTV